MQLVDKPMALPGQCKGCGTGDRGPFLDTGWQEEFYGAIYFCRDCTIDMASYYDLVSPEKYASLQAELGRAKQEITKLEIKLRANSQIMEGVDGLVDLRFSDRVDSQFSADVPIDVELEATDLGEASLAEGTGESPKPSNVKGVGDLRPSKSTKPISV